MYLSQKEALFLQEFEVYFDEKFLQQCSEGLPNIKI